MFKSYKKFSIALLSFLFFHMISPIIIKAASVEDKIGSTEDDSRVLDDNRGAQSRNNNKSTNEFAGKTTVITPDRVPYKDPRLSCLLSFIIPGGGGQFYLRNDLKGIIFCLSSLSLYSVSFYYLYQGILVSSSNSRSQIIIGSIGIVGSLIIHIVGMVESYNDAVELNEANYYFSE